MHNKDHPPPNQKKHKMTNNDKDKLAARTEKAYREAEENRIQKKKVATNTATTNWHDRKSRIDMPGRV